MNYNKMYAAYKSPTVWQHASDNRNSQSKTGA